jgi:hypothetical protein
LSHKPVVRLLLLRSADVARYRLPDHPISPSPLSFPLLDILRTVFNFSVKLQLSSPQAAPESHCERFRHRPALFHRVTARMCERRRKDRLRRVKPAQKAPESS